MSDTKTPAMREWRVVIQGHYAVGDIGSVVEATEEQARAAAISKFGAEGNRKSSDWIARPREAIYEDDDFDVRLA